MTFYYINFLLLLPKKSPLSKLTLPSMENVFAKKIKDSSLKYNMHTLTPSFGYFCFVTCPFTFGLIKHFLGVSCESGFYKRLGSGTGHPPKAGPWICIPSPGAPMVLYRLSLEGDFFRKNKYIQSSFLKVSAKRRKNNNVSVPLIPTTDTSPLKVFTSWISRISLPSLHHSRPRTQTLPPTG